MISKWSKQDYNSELEYIKKGEKEFIDERGKSVILNYQTYKFSWVYDSKRKCKGKSFSSNTRTKSFTVKGQFISVIKIS